MIAQPAGRGRPCRRAPAGPASHFAARRCGRCRYRCATRRRSRLKPPRSTGPTSVSITTPPLTLARGHALAPLSNALPVSSHAPANERPAHEIREAAELPKVASGQDVVVIAADFPVVERPEMKRRAHRELVGRQRTIAERRAAAAQHEQAPAIVRPARSCWSRLEAASGLRWCGRSRGADRCRGRRRRD